MAATERRVPCPQCGQPALFSERNRWRPFCGERCRNIDLGAWASESYRVGSAGQSDADDDSPPAAEH